MSYSVGSFTKIIATILIAVGIGIVAYVLPQAIGIIQLPAEAPFMQQLFTWVMSETSSVSEQISDEFFEIFQAFMKMIVVVIFLFACIKLTSLGVVIIREGVNLLKSSAPKQED